MNFPPFRRFYWTCPDFDDPCYAPGHINTVCRPFVRDLDTWQGCILFVWSFCMSQCNKCQHYEQDFVFQPGRFAIM